MSQFFANFHKKSYVLQLLFFTAKLVYIHYTKNEIDIYLKFDKSKKEKLVQQRRASL